MDKIYATATQMAGYGHLGASETMQGAAAAQMQGVPLEAKMGKPASATDMLCDIEDRLAQLSAQLAESANHLAGPAPELLHGQGDANAPHESILTRCEHILGVIYRCGESASRISRSL